MDGLAWMAALAIIVGIIGLALRYGKRKQP